MKKFILTLILSAGLFGLCGCSSTSLENTAVIKAVAFDASDEGFTVTACVLNPEGEKPFVTISADGRNMTEAVSRLAATTERKPFFSQCEIAVFSEELAEKGIGEITDWFYASAEGNKSMLMCVLREEASEAFSYTEGLFKDPAVDISRTLRNAEENGGHVAVALGDVRLAKDSVNGCCLVPVCEITGDEDAKSFSVCGAGVISGGRLTDELTEDERLGAKCMLSSAGGSAFNVEYGGLYGIKLSSSYTSLAYESGKIICDTEVVFEICEGIYGADVNLGGAVAEHIRQCMENAYKKAQSSGDFIGIAAAALNKNPQLMEKYGESWQEKLRETEIDIRVSAVRKGGGYPPLGVF